MNKRKTKNIVSIDSNMSYDMLLYVRIIGEVSKWHLYDTLQQL